MITNRAVPAPRYRITGVSPRRHAESPDYAEALPPDLRCNAVVTNLDAFYDAFEVTEKDALYTPESDRVRIW